MHSLENRGVFYRNVIEKMNLSPVSASILFRALSIQKKLIRFGALRTKSMRDGNIVIAATKIAIFIGRPPAGENILTALTDSCTADKDSNRLIAIAESRLFPHFSISPYSFCISLLISFVFSFFFRRT